MTGIKKNCGFGNGRKWCISFLKKIITSEASVNEVLAQYLHKAVIKKFKRRKVYLRFKYIWTTDLAEMRSLSSNNPFFTEYASWFYCNSK